MIVVNYREWGWSKNGKRRAVRQEVKGWGRLGGDGELIVSTVHDDNLCLLIAWKMTGQVHTND